MTSSSFVLFHGIFSGIQFTTVMIAFDQLSQATDRAYLYIGIGIVAVLTLLLRTSGGPQIIQETQSNGSVRYGRLAIGFLIVPNGLCWILAPEFAQHVSGMPLQMVVVYQVVSNLAIFTQGRRALVTDG